MNTQDLNLLSKAPIQSLHQLTNQIIPQQSMINSETLYNRFINFFRMLKHVNDNDTNPEDAFTTLYLNQQYDVVSCRIVKYIKPSHIRTYKDENGMIYYEVYIANFTRNILDFITDFQILNSKGDVTFDFVHSALPQKYTLKKTDVINCFYIANQNIPFGVRFTFKGEAYPIEFSYAGYIFNINTKRVFTENFGNHIFLQQ